VTTKFLKAVPPTLRLVCEDLYQGSFSGQRDVLTVLWVSFSQSPLQVSTSFLSYHLQP
jgi:hypothetical protein